jgi:hypothetical protein
MARFGVRSTSSQAGDSLFEERGARELSGVPFDQAGAAYEGEGRAAAALTLVVSSAFPRRGGGGISDGCLCCRPHRRDRGAAPGSPRPDSTSCGHSHT